VGRFESGVVVKAVAGTRHDLLITHKLKIGELPDNDVLSACPAIYQELIEGEKHIRLNQFGESSYGFLVTSENLDWRPQLTSNIEEIDIDNSVSESAIDFLKKTELRMGVFDVKLDTEDRPIFFEVNPQGQFLFLEGVTGVQLGDHFCEFLVSEMA